MLLGGLLWAVLGTILAFFTGFGFLLFAFLAFGVIIIIGSTMMNGNPATVHSWGIVILVLGILSLFGVVTTFGGILSIIGGALALSWNPPRQPQPVMQYQ